MTGQTSAPTTAEQTIMFAEAASSATVVATQSATNEALFVRLGEALRALKPQLVMTCARGSSDNAATYAKYLIETRLSLPTLSHAPSISSVYGVSSSLQKETLFIVISQSGKSPDIVESARRAKEAGAMVVALLNMVDAPVAAFADFVVPLCAGLEKSVAATKSFIASLSAITSIVAHWSNNAELKAAIDKAPADLTRAWNLDWSRVAPRALTVSNMYVVSRGLSLAIAQEAALKLKETCGIHAEAISAAEVKHGPMAIVSNQFPVLMFAPNDETGADFKRLSEDFLARDALVFGAGTTASEEASLAVTADVHPAIYPLTLIQSFYRFAAALSVARGLDPDRPPFLSKVTETR
jgi:glutamine---fructose-6-phosphate transaminase (isomerizing)